MNILEKICATKKEHVADKKSQKPLAELKSMIGDQEKPRGFLKRMIDSSNGNRAALITEVKKASPSKGVIRDDFNPAEIAKIYENAGASCISVLTDEPYFQGHDEFLAIVKNSVKIPVLRKDFMIDPYQIYESRYLGADCILLIMAALSDDLAQELYNIAVDLNMDILVEVHNSQELERAILLNPMMIGVNNRNLKTLKVDVQTSLDLLVEIPDNIYKISESGISSNKTIKELYERGYNGFLVGESLMRQDDIAMAVHDLLDYN